MVIPFIPIFAVNKYHNILFMQKHIIGFVFITVFSWQSFSQIIITADEILDVGDVVIQGFNSDPPATITPGEAGADKTWDYTELNIADTDTFNFVSPINTPYWQSFPGSNICLHMQKDANYVYFNKNDNDLQMMGVALKIDELGRVESKVKPPEEFLKFPYEYGYMVDETFDYVFVADGSAYSVDSVRLKRITDKSSEVDAWGTMSVPMGTYEVLRVHETREIKDSIWGKLPFIGWQFLTVEQSSEERYLWWSDDPEVGYVLVNLNVDVDNGNVTSAEFMAEPMHVGSKKIYAVSDAEIFPNPVKDFIHLKATGTGSKEFMIFNSTGEIVFAQNFIATNKDFYLGFLEKGFYVYKIIGESYSCSGKIIKI